MILIVDYEPRTTELLRGLLLSLGHAVEVSPNGEDAELRFAELKPDAIIAELMIPRKPGIELIRSIRKTEHGKDIPVIMMCSKFGSKRYRPIVTKELRAVAFLEKPFDDVEIQAQLTAALPPAPAPAQPAPAAAPKAPPVSARPAPVPEAPVAVPPPMPLTPAATAPRPEPVAAAVPEKAPTKAPDKDESEISDRLDELFSGF